MLRYGRALDLEPVRVIVELDQDAFSRLNKISRDRRIPPADLLKAIALKLGRD